MTLPDTRAEQRTLSMPSAAVNGTAIVEAVASVPGGVETFKAVNEVDAEAREVDPKLVTTSKGIKLRVQAVPNMAMVESRRKFKPPRVPVVYVSDKETHEENPMDPDYLEAVKDHNILIGTMGATAMLAFGTQLVHRPADVQAVEDEEWSNDLKEIFDLDVPVKGKGRYAAWLRLYALTDADLTTVLTAVGAASGVVTEQAVADAEDQFRPDAEGRATEGVLPSTEG